VTKRLAEGAAGAAVEKGYGTGAQQAALERAAAAAAASQHKSVLGQVPLDKKWDAANAQAAAANNANAAKAASRLSSFFQRAGPGGAPAPVPIPAVNFGIELDGRASKKSRKGGQSVKFRQDVAGANSLFSPPMHAPPVNPRDINATAAALLRSPEWIAGLAQAASAPSPAAPVGGAAVGGASWASPAFVAPLQALYSFYSGAIGPKTVGGDVRRASGASEGDLEGADVSLSGLSGLSPTLFGASPAEVEATLHREVMQAAAQAAVQAAMAGVNPPDSVVREKMDAGARATRAAATRETGLGR
jgi:hypothetical protein